MTIGDCEKACMIDSNNEISRLEITQLSTIKKMSEFNYLIGKLSLLFNYVN